MCGLIVNATAGRGTSLGEPIDADPGADLVVGPRVIIRPVVQLFVDPRQAGHGAVGKAVAYRLRLRRLLQIVTTTFCVEPL